MTVLLNPWLDYLQADPAFGPAAAKYIRQHGTAAACEAAAQAGKSLSGGPRKPPMVGTAEATEDAIFRNK